MVNSKYTPSKYIKNAYTLEQTEYLVGSKDELRFFRVMPLDGNPGGKKLFFSNRNEYELYSGFEQDTKERKRNQKVKAPTEDVPEFYDNYYVPTEEEQAKEFEGMDPDAPMSESSFDWQANGNCRWADQ